MSDRFDRSIGDATRQERHGANMTERLQRLLGSQLGMNLGGAPTDAPQVDTAEQVYISSLALLKMLKHGRAGVPMEVSENVAPITNNKASSRSFLLPVTATRIITSTSAREFGRSVGRERRSVLTCGWAIRLIYLFLFFSFLFCFAQVMGLMLGEFVDDYTVRVVDVFAMPQSGTGVSVEAVDPVFQTKMLDMLKQTGRNEMVVGWYHSHPGKL